MHWFIEQFGRDAALGEVALPTPDFLPTPYSETQEQIAAMVNRAYNVMSVEVPEIRVQVFGRPGDADVAPQSDTRRTVGHYTVENGRPVIAMELGEASDPAYLMAIIAHELGHVRLLGEGRITTTRKDHERLTDLLTVYLGFGVFTANAALRYAKADRGWTVKPLGYLDERRLNAAHNDGYSRLGYLTEAEFGYAMACHAWLRHETEPGWARHLDPNPRAHLEQGLAHLSRTAEKGRFPTLGTGTGRISIRVVAKGDSLLTGLFLPTSYSPRGERHA